MDGWMDGLFGNEQGEVFDETGDDQMATSHDGGNQHDRSSINELKREKRRF